MRTDSQGISASNLKQFFSENLISTSDAKVQELIRHYDLDNDGLLSYKEFMDIVLPLEHPNLRAFVTQKECFDISPEEYLSYECEAALVDLLSSEISLMGEVMPEKITLQKAGLDAESIVCMVDSQQKREINFENLRDFLHDAGLMPYDAEIVACLRRLDRDEDGAVDIDEMVRFLSRFKSYEEVEETSNRRICGQKLITMSPGRAIVKNRFGLLTSGIENDETMLEIEERERIMIEPGSIRLSPVKKTLEETTLRSGQKLNQYRNRNNSKDRYSKNYNMGTSSPYKVA